MANNKICIYAICKNEKQFVEQWLESMSEADYIVVLDTGSTDGTYEMLKADPRVYKVEQKIISPWRFDVARNEAIKLVPEDANILFSTDLDELLDKGWSEQLRQNWIEGKHKRAYYTYIWSHNESGEPGRILSYDRVHNKDWQWQFPVHENLVAINKEELTIEEVLDLRSKIILHHWPDVTKPRAYYLELLKLRVVENATDYQSRLYLAHEYFYTKHYEEAIMELKYILLCHYNNLTSAEKSNCFLFIGDSLKATKEYTEAINYYYQAILADETYREAYFALADTLNIIGKFKHAIVVLEECLEKTYRHYNWLERDYSWAGGIYELLGASYFWSGNYEKAVTSFIKALAFNPSDPMLINNLKLAQEKLEIK